MLSSVSVLTVIHLAIVAAYGEGNAGVTLARWSRALDWDPASGISDCAVVAAGTAIDARLLISLPSDASELDDANVCVQYTIRSDTAENWWFVSPPRAEAPHLACAPTQRTRHITVALDGLVLPRGYTRLTAWLRQPRHSTTPLVAALDAVVAVVEVPERPAWLGPTRLALDDKAASRLEESFRVVREDERPEREAYAARTREGRAAYSPLHVWDEEPSASVAALRGLLSPALLAALERPSPAALWRLLETPSTRHPVHRLQLFSREGAARLASELEHAHGSAALGRSLEPTNNVSDTAGASAAAEALAAAARAGPPSLLLDEVRLHAVAHAVAAAVLAPLARLAYPEWTLGGRLDSYHAFSIHRRAAAEDQTSWFRPASNSEEGGAAREAEAARHRNASAAAPRTGVHSDVCEVSLNVALRASSDLLGSRVGFEPGFAADGGGGGEEEEVLWLEHAAGSAFLNLCQHRHGVDQLLSGARDTVVVRGFTSGFRRAPAEGWYERCVAPASGPPHDEL